MATLLDVRDLALHLGEFVTRVRAGEEITIGDGGEPIARLVPVLSNDGCRSSVSSPDAPA